MKRLLTTACVALSLTACSSVINDSQTQQVSFAVIDRESMTLIPASCTVTSDIGNFFELTQNPATIEVTKGQSHLIVNCNKPGYTQKELAIATVINTRWDYTSLTRISGFMVNMVTGDATRFPSNIVVFMEKKSPYNTPALTNHAYKEAMKNSPFFQGKR